MTGLLRAALRCAAAVLLSACGPVTDPVPPACSPACQPDEVCRNHVCVRKDQVSQCDGGSCDAPQPCSVTCEGCCDDETCLAGDADDACGKDGAACEGCGEGRECSAERACVTKLPQAGEACTGSCDAGLLCVPESPGDSYCRARCESATCGAGYTCLPASAWGGTPAGSACVPAPASTSRWSVHVRSVKLATSGFDWDWFGDPDPMVCIVLRDGDEACTSFDTDVYEADWSGPLEVGGAVWSVPASKLDEADVQVWDDDMTSYDRDEVHIFTNQSLKPPWKGHALDVTLADSSDGVLDLKIRISPLP